MFEALSDKLKKVLKDLRGEGRLTQEHLDLAMREIRIALLEADVNFRVVKDFVERVKAAALGQEVMQALSPADVGEAFALGLATLLRIVILIAIASLIWVPIGVWVGTRPRATRVVQPIAQFLAAFPANLLFPLVVSLIVTYGLNPDIWLSPLMILGTQWYILFNVVAGAAAIRSELRDCCANLEQAIRQCRDMQRSNTIKEHLLEISRLENEADRISRSAIAALFVNGVDPITLIKLKELYETLETATDKAEDVANVLESVVLKNA